MDVARDEHDVFIFQEEGRDQVHSFVGVSVSGIKAGQLCLRHEEWEWLRDDVLRGVEGVQVKEYEPWPGE